MGNCVNCSRLSDRSLVGVIDGKLRAYVVAVVFRLRFFNIDCFWKVIYEK